MRSSSLRLCTTAAACVCLVSGLPAAAFAQLGACTISTGPPPIGAVQTEPPINATPHFGTHGQLIYGEGPIYLSHLAVFMGEPTHHPHNFQVVLEVGFADFAAEAAYHESLIAAPNDIHTVVPPAFDQMALATSEPGRMLRTFPGTRIVRGHFEQGGRDITSPTELKLNRVVYFREFGTGAVRDEIPRYLLFGRSDEAFLTHLISAPPDFQQVLPVELTPGEALPEQLNERLAGGLLLSLPDRENTVDGRLRAGETIACSIDASTGLAIASIEIRIAEELYCEQGELSSVVVGKFNDAERCSH